MLLQKQLLLNDDHHRRHYHQAASRPLRIRRRTVAWSVPTTTTTKTRLKYEEKVFVLQEQLVNVDVSRRFHLRKRSSRVRQASAGEGCELTWYILLPGGRSEPKGMRRNSDHCSHSTKGHPWKSLNGGFNVQEKYYSDRDFSSRP